MLFRRRFLGQDCGKATDLVFSFFNSGKNGLAEAPAAGFLEIFYMITDKRLCLSGLVLRATDGFLLATTLLLTLLALFFHSRVEGWPVLVLMNAAAALLYVCVVFAGWKVRSRVAKFLLRTSAVEGYFIYLFLVVHKLQLIIVRSWQDPAVLGLERSVFGVQPNVWLQKFTTPVLTEWLMFAYVIYNLIYPVLAALIYFKRGEDKLEDYFFTLAVVNVICCLGFILFPVASPMHWIRGQFTVPLKGFFFTSVGEFVRGHLHPVGGSIPSPHAAVGSIMALMAFKYERPLSHALAPVILSLYVATFYGRYHYITDTIAGILAAVLAAALAPVLVKGWNALVTRRSSDPHHN